MTNTYAILLLLGSVLGAESGGPPPDFPRFVVPGAEQEMAALRDLFWLHYPSSGPKATLWDEWLPDAALWPAVDSGDAAANMRRNWSAALSKRILDPEGYVATHQHASIAHQLGWPFPFWNQGRRGCGWHFSFKNTIGAGWRPNNLSTTDGWELRGAADGGLGEDGWMLEVREPDAVIVAPAWLCDTFEVPFLQLRWRAEGLGKTRPYIAWTSPDDEREDSGRRMYFDPPGGADIEYAMIPMYRHPAWSGEVRQLRIGLGNTQPGKVVIQAFFSQYDTRHNINGQNFIRGCAKYFFWTGDLTFLRANIQRMRTALRYLMHEHRTLEAKVVVTDWVGHDGLSGIRRTAQGKEILTGRGIGNNYWDLLPFGGKDCYATVQYYDAVRTMAEVEREILAHPEWNIPRGFLAFSPDELERHAAEVKETGNTLFWNPTAGRFVACVDAEGKTHDYGFTFLNLEAVYYDFATPEHAEAVLSWIDGKRTIEGDTSQGEDIYHWRFAPRATTLRNIDWYFWAWSNPESIPFGGQVQDGGAVLGFSYHDLSARLRVLGPNNAWNRLKEIIRWFEEVQAAGGYRAYYDGTREGSLQGGGTAGGLGLDREFFESVLVPQIMLYGFLGFHPRGDGFALEPRLPDDWPELTIDRIRYQDVLLQITASRDRIEIRSQGTLDQPLRLILPQRNWRAESLPDSGTQAPGPIDRGQEHVWSIAPGRDFAVRFQASP
ncbi:glycosyl hydrolase family 65 protein [Thermopirellula anaerolimosa]